MVMAAVNRLLPGPYEMLELKDMQVARLKISSWEEGTIIIHPRYPGAPKEKEVQVLRLHLPEGVKQFPPYFYDITSKTLIAQIRPMMSERNYDRYQYVITAYGVAPRKRFTVTRIPL